MTTAIISDIKRFSVHDGDGIRTTVFLKGCPLNCVWCHNPEGISPKPQLAYYKDKCLSCGECADICSAHSLSGGLHLYDREKCIGCGRCEKICLGNALKFYGRRTDVDSLVTLLLEDKDFYDNSGGGVTVSGGEPLMQADFCTELLKKLKENAIHTAVDTCGCVSKEAFVKVIPYTDIFLFDVKAISEEVHLYCTGLSNRIILENLRYIDRLGIQTEIRIPYVPDYNSGEIEKIGMFLSKLNCITKVKVLPYHNFAGSKYQSLGMKNRLPEKLPSDEDITSAVNILISYGLNAQG